MISVVSILLASISAWFRSRLSVPMELIALHHQVVLYKQSVSRPKLRPIDRYLWVWRSRLWPGWQEVLTFVQPRTVIAWQKKRFRNYWRRCSQSGKPGRPAIVQEVRTLIQDMGSQTQRGARLVLSGSCGSLASMSPNRRWRNIGPGSASHPPQRGRRSCTTMSRT